MERLEAVADGVMVLSLGREEYEGADRLPIISEEEEGGTDGIEASTQPLRPFNRVRRFYV